MLDNLKWEFDTAVIVCEDGTDIPLTQTWNLDLQDFNCWYDACILLAADYGKTVMHVITFFEDVPTMFYIDEDAELCARDLTDIEKIYLN